MASIRLSILTTLSLLLMTSPLSAAIYKWKDEAGQVHYGSTPPQGTAAQRMGVSTTFTPAPSKKTTKTDAANDKTTEAGSPEDNDPYTQQQHDTLCKNARKDIETMNKSGRLRVKQEDGSTAVMSDTDREKRMKKMQEMVKKHCK